MLLSLLALLPLITAKVSVPVATTWYVMTEFKADFNRVSVSGNQLSTPRLS